MSIIRYRKGMTLKEFRDVIAAAGKQPRKKCHCACDGCRTPGTHCLSAVCGLTRNRRTVAQMDADERKKPPRVKVPKKPKEPVTEAKTKPDSRRAEWFVDAKRGKTELTLAAPDGEAQANTMVDRLIRQGWEAKAVIRNTFKTDPRFHEYQ